MVAAGFANCDGGKVGDGWVGSPGLHRRDVLERAHLDDGVAGVDEAAGLGETRCLCEVVRLDQDEPADRLFGFEEGTVGDDIVFCYILPLIVQGAGTQEISCFGHLVDPISHEIALVSEVFRRERRPAFEVFADEQ